MFPDSQPPLRLPRNGFDLQSVEGILGLFISGCKLRALCAALAFAKAEYLSRKDAKGIRKARREFWRRLKRFADFNAASIIPLSYHTRTFRSPNLYAESPRHSFVLDGLAFLRPAAGANSR